MNRDCDSMLWRKCRAIARRFSGRPVSVSCVLPLFVGCAGNHSALDPAGPHAEYILWLGYLFFGICTVVYVAVVFVLLSALIRSRSSGPPPDVAAIPPDPHRERKVVLVVGGATALTVVLLFVLLIGDIIAAKSIRAMEEPDPLKITITGYRWWWKVEYPHETASNTVVTANEIHVPVGRAIRLELRSADVIHSFWLPNLLGKRDMIPGYPTSIWLKVDRAGTYFGQCAEYCGLQHAHMRILLVAEPEADFDAWLEAQRRPAAEPTTEEQARGQRVFLTTTCMMCHTIRGTIAHGLVGPDLTHLASRSMIAGNSLDNTPGHLAGWVANPQTIKPGVAMPPSALAAEDLRALLAYLERLE